MATSNVTIHLNAITNDTRRPMVDVRILRLWVQKDKNGKEGLEMIVIDQWGDKIQVSVSVGFKRKFAPLLKEGNIYTFSNFQVLENNLTFQSAKINHAWRIGFALASKVTKPDVFIKIPEDGFQFYIFKDIDNHDPTYVLDVLGEVIDRNVCIDYVEMYGCKTAKMEVVFTDADGSQITCVLWESFAHQMNSFLETLSSADKEPVIVALQFAKMSTYRGQKKISTMKNATKMFIRPDVQEVKDFIKRRGLDSATPRCDSTITGSSSISDFNMNEWLNSTIARTIQGISDSKEDGIYICKGTIQDFHPTESWYYDSCGNDRCFKRVHRGCKVGDVCKKCNRPIRSIVIRYLLKVLVVDHSHSLYMTIFEDCARQLLKKSAAQVMQEMLEQESSDIYETPDVLSTMLDRECLFKIDVRTWSSERGYTVKMITEDSNILNQFSSLRIGEVDSALHVNSNLTEKSAGEECDFEETGSTSTNNQMTPLKRNSKFLSQDDLDGLGAQLSSTKRSKK